MVVPLGPGKFYGSSLPRPRYYTDVRFNTERVDPPVPVLDPFLSWANEAHWSMGGLSFKRLRLQGRIEGSIKRLRNEREKLVRSHSPIVKTDPDLEQKKEKKKQGNKNEKKRTRSGSVSPPPAPMATKRRRRMVVASSDEDDDGEEEEMVEEREKGRVARKLVGEFDKVANKGVGDDVMRVIEELDLNESVEENNKKKNKKLNVGDNGLKSGSRSSPRLAKRKLG